MNFLAPAYLVALAAVAVPVLIHIFARRRVPEMPWSSIRFLRPADRRSMVRINVRRLLLLALRVAGVALVALALARPVVRGSLASLFPAGGSRAACILLDRSYSMGVETDGGTAFERAKARIEPLLAELSGGDRVTVVLFDTAAEVAYDGELDPPAVLASLAGTAPSWRGTDLRAAVAFGRRALERSGRETRELYLLSDFQRTGLGEGRGAEGRSGEPVRALLLPVAAGDPANVAIEDVSTPRAALRRGEAASLGIVMRNAARDREARFPIEVEIGGRRVMEKEIAIPPGGAHVETAVAPVERSGWTLGIVRKRPDRLAADDTRYFALRAREKTNVLLIAEGGSFYLEQALSPAGAESGVALVTKSARGFTTADLERADAVVLGPGPGLEDRDAGLVRRFVSDGGSALVLVLPELAAAARRLSGARLSMDFAETPGGFFTIRPPEPPPAFLAPFGEEDLRALARVRFRRAALVRGAREGDVRLAFSTGHPFVWEERIGEGTVIFACLDPRPEAGELVLSPLFLPLVQQLVLAGGARRGAAESVLVGEEASWEGSASGEIEVRMPDGSALKAGTAAGGAASEIAVPPSGEPGFIAIVAGPDTVSIIAVNPDCRRESDLSPLPAREAADSLGLEHRVAIDEGGDFAAAAREAREGKEIALPLLVAAIAVFAVELFVAQRAPAGAEENHVG